MFKPYPLIISLTKVKDIIKTFRFKSYLLESEAADMANEQLVADLECILEDINKDQETGFVSLENSCNEEQLDTDSYN